MLDYGFLLDLAIILLSTKLFAIISKKIKMPQVVGALVAGLVLGPAVLNIVHETAFIKQLSEIGVIVLMFSAGMETNLKELKECGKASFIIAFFGVLIPLLAGFGIAAIYNGGFYEMNNVQILKNIFIGVVLTATSVSITVETLKEMGKLKTKSGTTILGAALIDDILGIIILTVITSSADLSAEEAALELVLLKIIGFFLLCAFVGFPFYYLFNKYTKGQKQRRRFVLISFSLCLILSFIAEHFFGVADITGAFIAGIILSNTEHVKFINRRFEITSYVLLSPIFFASVGISVEKTAMSPTILAFSFILLIVAILSKVVGCGLGALMCNFSKQDSLKIGVGMISRGEVALIVLNKGASAGLVDSIFFGPVVLMVVVTTIITPILLKIVYGRRKEIECAQY